VGNTGWNDVPLTSAEKNIIRFIRIWGKAVEGKQLGTVTSADSSVWSAEAED